MKYPVSMLLRPKREKSLTMMTVDLIGPHQLNELLYLRTLKIRAAVPVVDELHDLRVQSFRHGSCILMEDKALIFNTQTVVLVVLNGDGVCRGQSHISALFQHLRIGFKLALEVIAHRDLLIVGYLNAVDQLVHRFTVKAPIYAGAFGRLPPSFECLRRSAHTP